MTYYDALNRVFRLFKERRLPSAPQLVMCWILQEHNRAGNTGQVELSDRELISMTGLSKSSITDAKRILKSYGLIDWKLRKGVTTIYKLTLFEERQLVGQSAGHKVGQSVGQSSRFSVPSSTMLNQTKTQDAPAHEATALTGRKSSGGINSLEYAENSWVYDELAKLEGEGEREGVNADGR